MKHIHKKSAENKKESNICNLSFQGISLDSESSTDPEPESDSGENVAEVFVVSLGEYKIFFSFFSDRGWW